MSQPYILPCGTHAGNTLQQIIEQDPAYIEQCVKTALLIEQLPAIQGLLPLLSSGAIYPSVSPPSVVSETSGDPHHVTQDPRNNSAADPTPLIDLSGSRAIRHPQRTAYNDLHDIMFAIPSTSPTPTPLSSRGGSSYSIGRSDTPDALQQLHMLYPNASSTAIQLIYQMLPIYPSLTIDTLCVQCGQPFSRHKGLSCPMLLTGTFIPSTPTLAHRV